MPSKDLVIKAGEIKTPPMSSAARIQTGYLIRQLQEGENLSLPQSRPMPNIGRNCHELRISDDRKIWRVFYYLDTDAVVILDVFAKTTRTTPKKTIDTCKFRLADYLNAIS